MPIGTVRSRLWRAREALRLLMGIDEEAKSVAGEYGVARLIMVALQPCSRSLLQSRGRRAQARHLATGWIGGS
jgi:hypothetical protein